MRLRPHGKNYLWSEAHSLPNILAQESRVGFLRSLVCYPSHPSSDLFRCCLSIRDVSLLYLNNQSHSSFHTREATRDALDLTKLKKHFRHQVKLTTPLLIKNYLPKPLSLTVEIGGSMYTEFLPEVSRLLFFDWLLAQFYASGLLRHLNLSYSHIRSERYVFQTFSLVLL